MRGLIILLFFDFAVGRYLFMSMAKSLYIPAQRYSLINITHNFDNDAYQFDISIEFNLTQVHSSWCRPLPITSRMLSLTFCLQMSPNIKNFSTATTNPSNTLTKCTICTNPAKSISIVRRICTFSGIESFEENNTLSSLSLIIGDNENPNAQKSMIIDNTFYPCADGAYQP